MLAPLIVLAILSWSILHVNNTLVQHEQANVNGSKGHVISGPSILKIPGLHLQFSNGGAAPNQTTKPGTAFLASADDIKANLVDQTNQSISSVVRSFVQQYLFFIYPSHNFW